MQMNKPSPRLAILRAQLDAKAEAEQLQRDTMRLMALAPIRCKAPAPDAATLPLPPSYWDDLEHWLKTLAPAKPAAPQPEPSADVWHSKAPSVAGVYMTRWAGFTGTKRHWDGSRWSEGHAGANRDTDRQNDSCREEGPVEWLRLVEADVPTDLTARLASTSGAADGAALVGAALEHIVCIKQHATTSGKLILVGGILRARPQIMQKPDCWLPCDKDGFIPHTPTADSTCPVPDGVRYQARLANGEIGVRCGWTDMLRPERRITAWRPIAESSK